MGSRSTRALLRAARILLLLLDGTHGALIASSRLEQCYNDGNPETLMDCEQRITVSMAIPAGQIGTEEVRMVQDPNKKSRELEKPIRLTVTKSQAVVRYPVTCAQTP